MAAIINPLIGAALTVATSLALGWIVVQALHIRLYRAERHAFGFVIGAACLSVLVLGLSALHLARKGVFYGLAASALLLAYQKRTNKPAEARPPLPRWLGALFLAVTLPFLAMYLLTAWAPEVSPDGSTYHLGNVLRFWSHNGLVPIRDIYGALPEGLEMLFLYAFSVGRHSAAALVHLSFLIALPLLMISYALRYGFPRAGILAAVLVFASPVVGKDASIAYNDVALASVLFGVFYIMQLWIERNDDRLLIIAGVLSGFCFDIKYTGSVAILYAFGYILLRFTRERLFRWRPLAFFVAPCVLLVAPWLIKNVVYMRNPVSPFFNTLFPNPYISAKFERDYSQSMANYAGTKNLRELALLYTTSGTRVVGFLGPLFLLLPLSLVSLRSQHGRRLLFAGLFFGLPILSNGGTRFLIPALPCLSLALALAVADTKFAVPVLMIAHALASWPDISPAYCDRYAWRLTEVPIRPVFDSKAASEYLRMNLDGAYDMARVVEQQTPVGSRVFCINCPAQAYTSRELTVYYTSLEANALWDMLWTPMEKSRQPLKNVVFTFPRFSAKRIRVELLQPQANQIWQVSEFRVLAENRELTRSPLWKIHAYPNPWEAPFAFDNSPVSKWSTERYGARGSFIELAFDKPTSLDTVMIECVAGAPETLDLWAETALGSMVRIKATVHVRVVPAPSGMRRAAIQMLEAYGFKYLVMSDSDYYADDYKKFAPYWGIRAIAQAGDQTLFHLE